MPRTFYILALIAAFGSIAAADAGQPAEKKKPEALLEVKTREAGSAALLGTSAKPYAEARRLLARGQPAAALKAVAKSQGDMFADREALLRGDALLALGDQRRAKAAYLEALEKSQLESVSLAAARGLVNVLAITKDREEQLLYLDALLEVRGIARRPYLQLQKAGLLRDLGRVQDAAELAAAVARDYPSTRVAEQASELVDKLRRRGARVAAPSLKLELSRCRSLVRAGDWRRAEAEMNLLERSNPKLARSIGLLRAEMFKRRRMKSDEYAVLEKVYTEGGLEDAEEVEVLFRLGQLALARDDGVLAQRYFDELAAKHPNERETVEGQYLAAWSPYNMGDFDAAADRMLRFAETYRKAPNRAEALWFAGWSAYLANNHGRARRALEQLLEEHPTSDLGAQARYWIGRIRQRAADLDGARASYREVLSIAPLGYWGFWAMRRLEDLGEKVVLEPPPPTTISSVSQVVAMLGAKRPINIDRAIALHAADLRDDALDELTAANAYLKSVKDTMGRTMVADLLHSLGAHYLAFRVGAGIAQDGAELVTGKPHAWRAWRHAYPRAFEREIASASSVHEMDTALILSIMRTESSFRPKVRSPVGAYGLMQLMPGTAAQIGQSAKGEGRGHAARYKSPDSNVWLGTWYLKRLLERYGGQLAPAIGAYNAGPGAMDKWVQQFGGLELDEFVERVPYRETRRYIRRVLETYMVYRRLAGEPLLDLDGKVSDLAVPEGSVAF